MKLFFVIDGLDEYQGSSIEKTHLADLLKDMAASPRVKLLLSSRPESAFLTSFEQRPTLHLEKFTRPDIVNYVCDKIPHGRDERRRDEMRRTQNYIIRNARGVFLWVFLSVSIAVDGLNNDEDIRMIRTRIEELPQELDDLFRHILAKRIPPRYRKEAFRYLLIVLECQRVRDYSPGLSAQRWDGEIVPDVALAVAQQAADHETASHLARLEPQEIRIKIERLRSHLHSRCQGLLELSQLVMQNPAFREAERRISCVHFLHRTLFDYLSQHEEILALLKSEVGDGFDLHRAMMTGWIAFHKVQPTRPALGTFVRVQIPIIFRLNVLAERTTGRAQTELLVALDQDLTGRQNTIFPRPTGVGHWASEFVQDAGLLAYTISTGSSRYLREVIEQGTLNSDLRMRPLLQFAVPRYSDTENRRSDAINLEAATLLLEYGEDPLVKYQRSNAWRNAFTWITNCPMVSRSANSPHTLSVIRLMAKVSNDLNKCREMRVSNYTPAEAIREQALEATCCADMQLRVCVCTGAQGLSIDANFILLILESQTGVRETWAESTTSDHHGYPRRGRSQRTRERLSVDSNAGLPRALASETNGSRHRSNQRSMSSQRTFVSGNTHRPQLDRSHEHSRANDIRPFQVPLYDGFNTNQPEVHYGPNQEDLGNYQSDTEHSTRSRRGSFRTRPGRRTHSAHPHVASLNVPRAYSTEPHQRMSSPQPRGRDTVTPQKHRSSDNSVPMTRPAVRYGSAPPPSRPRNFSAFALPGEPVQPSEPDLRPTKRRRKRSFWHRLKQYLIGR
jgi:hypothetical protein